MPRTSAKALVIHNGMILLNLCSAHYGTYYALPGGGQRHRESMTDTIRRELLEETGYTVKPMRLSAVYESISENRSGLSAHKVYFIWLCALDESVPKQEPTHRDAFQRGAEWVSLDDIKNIKLFPRAVHENLDTLTGYGETVFLGSEKHL